MRALSTQLLDVLKGDKFAVFFLIGERLVPTTALSSTIYGHERLESMSGERSLTCYLTLVIAGIFAAGNYVQALVVTLFEALFVVCFYSVCL